ncbi:tectonic-3 [Sitophilus oryzae]|uniref:Tectonic-3 n=1 Tax=Sitophilus oryzae TaxID=7048 RepID=A0A6J2XV46_SITOR|nr:tectonic-3 [Sitophilus oryzae]
MYGFLVLLIFLSANIPYGSTIESLDDQDAVRSVTMTNTETTTTELSNITTTVNTCESNDTNCSTTPSFENSTLETSLDSENDTRSTRQADKMPRLKTDQETHSCTCNLKINICDINCCCDPDCQQADKAVFAYCTVEENYFYDTRYCHYIQYIYVNNSQVEWHVKQEGMFCVVSKNMPKSYLVQKDKPIKSFDATRKEIIGKAFWSGDNFTPNINDNIPKILKHYKYGDPIIVIKNSSIIAHFSLPNSFTSEKCVFEDEVFYLKNTKFTCSQTVIEDENQRLNFSTYYKNIKIINSQGLLNLSQKYIYKFCPRNVCIEIEPQICDAQLDKCIKIDRNISFKAQCTYNFKENINVCKNLVEKIHYNFYHNGSKGIHKIEVLGVLKNISYHFGIDSFKHVQEFSVEFLWMNETRNYSKILSGNPGYIDGKPILIGSKIIKENNTFIQRNSSAFIENFLTFAKNVGNKCIRNSTYNDPIYFGYNTIMKCKMSKKLSFSTKQQNATTACQEIQRIIFMSWNIKQEVNKSLVIGQFGNADPSKEENWSEVLYRINPKTLLDLNKGNFMNKNRTLVCQNISTLVDVDILFAKVDFGNLLNQKKILGTSYSFKDIDSFKVPIIKNKDSFQFDFVVELVSRVSFFDITNKKEKKFVEPPSIDIRLPYDFFYPFIRVHNGAEKDTGGWLLIMLVLYLNCIV